jgi:hypothetical protein
MPTDMPIVTRDVSAYFNINYNLQTFIMLTFTDSSTQGSIIIDLDVEQDYNLTEQCCA